MGIRTPLDVFSLTVYCVTFVLGAPSNAVALCVFFKELRHNPTPNIIYMINLGISDSLFIAFLPIKMLETVWGEWILPEIFCPIYNVFHYSTIYASVLFLTALSVGRYLSVVFPIKYKMYKRPRYSCLVCFGFWLLVVGHITFVFLVETVRQVQLTSPSEGNASICFGNFTRAQLDLLVPLRLELCVVLFLVPLALTAFSYLSCARALSRSRLPRHKKQKALRVAVVTLVIYVVCFAPYNVSHLVGFVRNESVPWRTEVLLLSTANAFLDPLVFFFSSSALQRTARECWRSVEQRAMDLKESLPRLWQRALPRGKGLSGDRPQASGPPS